MRGDIDRFLFVFFLVIINFISLFWIMVRYLGTDDFVFQFYFILGILVVYSFLMFGVMNRFTWANILLALLFISFIIDVIFLLGKTTSILIYVISLASIVGTIFSYKFVSKNEPIIILPRRSYSKKELIDKELNDDWEEKPKIIYD